ncbi:hypothetical protein EJ04DRAFT_569242 [Polyplosphaeria fusca]|uniref:Uncharacterized protein n=1 Tax=Polyplosphaeria fusca TaxID=682080 RepID=A0A9P4QPU6_9PLEO|nr:hypothetical protein EJ04DRAFT_569242 [Polyplosphaeria fusca]
MDIDKRVPYRLGTAKLAPLPNKWDLVGDRFPPKVQEAMAIAREYLRDEPIAFFYVRRNGEKRKTVLILSSYAPSLKNKWCKAIEKLYKCFEHEEGLIAEILDYHVDNPPLPKPITMAEVDLYQVVALFNDHEWMTVDVLCWYSPVRQETWPTVVITARDAGKDSWWSEKIPAVEQCLKNQGLDLEVVLQFLDNIFIHSKDYYDMDPGRYGLRLYSWPKIGQSLGIPNLDGSATLGCRLLMEDGRKFGVTACQNFQQAPGSTQTALVGLNVYTPSPSDDALARKHTSSSGMEWLKKDQSVDLGKISAVSSGSSLADWCLFELHRQEIILDDPKVWARIKDGKTYQVKKQGRSTGLREGTINPSPSIVNSKYIGHVQDGSMITSVCCIVSKDKHKHFYLPGDSGASVQENDSGTILGLCTMFNKATLVSYMTPMATIINEIIDAVDSKIEEPKEIQLE